MQGRCRRPRDRVAVFKLLRVRGNIEYTEPQTKMPISVKTMRNIWDGERKAVKEQKESAVFSGSGRAFGKQAEEGLTKTRKYFFEHSELKKVVMDFFPDYQRYLGKGGFTKI